MAQDSKKSTDLKNPFYTSIWINASEDILSKIDIVVYYLHSTFNSNVRMSDSKENNFSISFTNLGKFNLHAIVYFKDGETKYLLLPQGDWKGI